MPSALTRQLHMHLTEQENKQVELGLAAEKIIADPTFGFVMNEMGNAYMNGIVQTKSEQTTEREGYYHSIKALQDINSTLAHWVQVKESIMSNLQNQDEQE